MANNAHPADYKDDFICCHCKKNINYTDFMGTKHRNHCNVCLWSKHVDKVKSGDRASLCKSCMKPIGLTFKNEGVDKYGRARQGELMLIHECIECGKISINRIASDDNTDEILNVFDLSKDMNKKKKEALAKENIRVISNKDKESVHIQIFGKVI